MSSGRDQVLARLFSQWATICKLIVDGRRDGGKVNEVLQSIIDQEVIEMPIVVRILSSLAQEIKVRGGTDNALNTLMQENGKIFLENLAQQAVRAEFRNRLSFSIIVDNDCSVEEMIVPGHYNDIDKAVNSENFPITKSGLRSYDVRLFRSLCLDSDQLIRMMRIEKGLRPVTLPELLALGATYPDLQREYTLICLGDMWSDPSRGGERMIPCLDALNYSTNPFSTDRPKRTLWCERYDRGWDLDRQRFPAVPIEQG